MSKYNPPETEAAVALLNEVLLTLTLHKLGIPSDAGDLVELASPTYADAEILPGDLQRITGLTERT